MKRTYLKDERGVAMLIELLLVAAVLAIAGVAFYQSHKTASNQSAASVVKPSVVNATVGLADSAAAISETESASDATLSASAEAVSSEVTDTDTDVSNLGGSSNESAY